MKNKFLSDDLNIGNIAVASGIFFEKVEVLTGFCLKIQGFIQWGRRWLPRLERLLNEQGRR